MNFIIIIPARFFSSRFPGKLLANIHGKPMIIRVIDIALTTQANAIIVATDNIKIKRLVESEYCVFKNKDSRIKVCLTKSTHQSGTERLLEVVQYYQFPNDQIIVHLQGDEPLISLFMIHQVVQTYINSADHISMSTLASPINSYQELENSNVVKVIVNVYNNALYFSRSRIPWSNICNKLNQNNNLWLKHIGIYVYRTDFLYKYMKWKKSPLEQIEILEQLRVLWYGEIIRVSIIDNDIPNISVDTPEQLKRVNELFLANK